MSQDNAAAVAYKKAIKCTRDEEYLKKNFPPWMQFFAMKLPEQDVADTELNIHETTRHRKERELRDSPRSYDHYGWYAYLYFTSQSWFEAFIMGNILLIGVATGVDLENDGARGTPTVTTRNYAQLGGGGGGFSADDTTSVTEF